MVPDSPQVLTLSPADEPRKKVDLQLGGRCGDDFLARKWKRQATTVAGRGISGTRKVARARHISGISWQPDRWSSKINPFSDAETALVATTKEPAGGFCVPGTASSINSCLQRSSRLPANFNGPLTHADRRFLMSRDASPSSSSRLHPRACKSFLFSCPFWPTRPDTASFPRDHAILLSGGYKISVSVIFKDRGGLAGHEGFAGYFVLALCYPGSHPSSCNKDGEC